MRKIKEILIDPFACPVTEIEHDASETLPSCCSSTSSHRCAVSTHAIKRRTRLVRKRQDHHD